MYRGGGELVRRGHSGVKSRRDTGGRLAPALPAGVPSISAIVPTLDEAARLPALLARLRAEVDEIVVSDGGSTDGTPVVATGATLVTHARGRGPQLHAGALAATGDLLWFLHADAIVPVGAGAALRAATTPWGCFATRLDDPDPRLQWTGFVMTQRARRTGSCTGDMGMWMRRELYLALGGFPPLRAFEDLELAERARAHPWTVLEPAIGTSARRWRADGINRTIARFLAVRAAWRLGAHPESLTRFVGSRPQEG